MARRIASGKTCCSLADVHYRWCHSQRQKQVSPDVGFSFLSKTAHDTFQPNFAKTLVRTKLMCVRDIRFDIFADVAILKNRKQCKLKPVSHGRTSLLTHHMRDIQVLTFLPRHHQFVRTPCFHFPLSCTPRKQCRAPPARWPFVHFTPHTERSWQPSPEPHIANMKAKRRQQRPEHQPASDKER